MVAHMMKLAAEKGKRSLFLVHRKELIDQTLATFNAVGLDSGLVVAGERPSIKTATLGSILTVANKLESLGKMDLVVYDEAHHVAAKSWSKVHGFFRESFHIGLTATPVRLDGRGLGEWFSLIIKGPSIKHLIDTGWLSKYRLFAPSNVDLKGCHTRMGDYVRGEIDAVVDKPSITGNVIDQYTKKCAGKRAIVFCITVNHAKNVAQQFADAGITSEYIEGGMNDERRSRIIRGFREGNVQVLCSCDLVGEGFDVPGIECAILLRPTQSFGLYRQQVGRALRPCEGKREAIILDHVGNSTRHGLPDEDTDWSLEGVRGKKRGESRPGPRICTTCFAASPAGSTVCGYCGIEFPVLQRKLDERAGELSEVDLAAERTKRRIGQGMCRTYEELVEEGKRRGYKHPHGWAYWIAKSRGIRR